MFLGYIETHEFNNKYICICKKNRILVDIYQKDMAVKGTVKMLNIISLKEIDVKTFNSILFHNHQDGYAEIK